MRTSDHPSQGHWRLEPSPACTETPAVTVYRRDSQIARWIPHILDVISCLIPMKERMQTPRVRVRPQDPLLVTASPPETAYPTLCWQVSNTACLHSFNSFMYDVQHSEHSSCCCCPLSSSGAELSAWDRCLLETVFLQKQPSVHVAPLDVCLDQGTS